MKYLIYPFLIGMGLLAFVAAIQNNVPVAVGAIAIMLAVAIPVNAHFKGKVADAKESWPSLIDGFHTESAESLADHDPGLMTLRELRLLEVTRHFDQESAGQIRGSMTHALSARGWTVSISGTRVGAGVGSYGLIGTSQVDLTTETTVRDNLMADGFVALFERSMPDGRQDVFRVIGPSSTVCRALVRQVVHDEATRLDEGPWVPLDKAGRPITQGFLLDNADRLLASITFESSYVADRLTAMLRTPEDRRPLVTVTGVPVDTHILLAGSVRINGDPTAHEILPLDAKAQLATLGSALMASLSARGATWFQ